jgi:Ca-activated chloride channel homolog
VNFYINPSYLEYILVALFFAIYLLYFILARYKADRLNLPLRSYFWAKLIFRSVYISFVFIALLGPIFGEEKQQIKVKGKDIVFAIDVSSSMDAQDVLPSRIEKVKYELQLLLSNPLQARMGLVTFASEAFSSCPLTKDYTLLQNIFIPALSTKQTYGQSTQMYNALDMSIKSVLREKEDKIHKRAKIVVLFTDGEDFGDDYSDLANLIQRKGIHLIIIGIGSEEGSPIPTPAGYKKNEKGEKVISKFNKNALIQLAQMSGGKYFEISKQGNINRNDMEKVKANLEEIQGTLEDKREIGLDSNKYYYFLIIAFIMICIDMMITTRIIKLKYR